MDHVPDYSHTDAYLQGYERCRSDLEAVLAAAEARQTAARREYERVAAETERVGKQLDELGARLDVAMDQPPYRAPASLTGEFQTIALEHEVLAEAHDRAFLAVQTSTREVLRLLQLQAEALRPRSAGGAR